MPGPVIEISNLTFSYGTEVVLEDVNLSVEEGDFASLVGPNGGGKTTLFKLMLGLLEPQRGKVRIFGKTPARGRRHIGYLTQQMRFDSSFPVTVMDVVLMGRLSRGLHPGPYSRRDSLVAEDVLQEVELFDQRKRPFAELSGGELQRVLIARALACEPQALLLDEPTANLDLQAEKEFYELMHKLNERLSIIIASHDLYIVSSYVDRVICVKRKVEVHPTGEINEALVRQMYDRDTRIVRHYQRS